MADDLNQPINIQDLPTIAETALHPPSVTDGDCIEMNEGDFLTEPAAGSPTLFEQPGLPDEPGPLGRH